jgi:hypothetical protein
MEYSRIRKQCGTTMGEINIFIVYLEELKH